MSVTVKACLLGKYEQKKEIRRFLVKQDVYSSFEKLSEKISVVFSKLKNSSFSLYYKDEDGDLVSFSSDHELMMGLGYMKNSTFHLFIKEKKEHHRHVALHALLPSIFGSAPPHAPRHPLLYAPPNTFPDPATIAPLHAHSSHPLSHPPPVLPSFTPSRPRSPDPIDRPQTPSDDLSLPLHPGVTCDSCNGVIRGVRHKCSECDDYDLCSTCKDENKHSIHILLPIAKPLPEFQK